MNIDILKSKNAYIPEENTIFYRFISQSNLSSHLDWNDFDISTIFKEKSDFFISPQSFARRFLPGSNALEEYVSILFSPGDNEELCILDCVSYLKKFNVPFKKRFGFVSFDGLTLLNYVNDDFNEDDSAGYIYITIEDDSIKSIDLFKKDDCCSAVHFGINYIQGSYTSEEILETKIIEILRDQFFFVENKDSNKYPQYHLTPPEKGMKIESISENKRLISGTPIPGSQKHPLS